LSEFQNPLNITSLTLARLISDQESLGNLHQFGLKSLGIGKSVCPLGLTPFDYLKLLMEELPKNPIDIDRLLPWNVEIPQQTET